MQRAAPCATSAGGTIRALQRTLVRDDLRLYAEQIEPHTNRHVGNFPQAFSHVGVVNAAWRLRQTAPSGS